MTEQPYDLLIIGGGINGAGIARDAAGRGLRVALCEQGDLAGQTSSKSTKLIHGGLRYLEHYEFRLVREALAEREVLLRAAPHIIWPLSFVLPHHPALRPPWMIRAGLFLYDHLGGRKLLPPSRAIELKDHPAGEPLLKTYRRAFVYSDCWVQDARLVVLNAMDARERGARIMTRTRLMSARREGSRWRATLRSSIDGSQFTLESRAIVNAAGPWIREVLDDRVLVASKKSVRLVVGSHVVVPRLFSHGMAYIFQNADGRVVFAIPYERDFTLIGTTERDFEGAPGEAQISGDEIDYLCGAVNEYFETKLQPDSIAWSYSGVRALFDDEAKSASAVTRDYFLELEAPSGGPSVLSVFGGKITTYRKLAEHALDRLAAPLGVRARTWTERAALPGGDIEHADFDRFHQDFERAHPWLPPALASRLARDYGTRASHLLGDAGGLTDLGERIGADLYEAELDYLMGREWAQSAEDVLWRRTKLGLRFTAAETNRLADWLALAAPASRHSA